MIVIPHLAAGAAVGRLLRRPWYAIPVAYGSHFLLDSLPHIDEPTIFGSHGRGLTATEVIAVMVDVLLGAALMWWAIKRRRGWQIMYLAAFAAVIPDLIDNVPPWNIWLRERFGISTMAVIHYWCENGIELNKWPIGFATQIAVTALALAIVLARPRKPE